MKNFLESIGLSKTAEIPEEVKTFEELGNTRDFGVLKFDQLDEFEKKNGDYWRMPTVEEITYLINQHKNDKKFFKYKKYWVLNDDPYTINKYLQVDIHGALVYFGDENPNSDIGLVMFRK